MSQQDITNLPLVEQIIAEVLEELAEHSVFDAETIARLRELAKTDGFVNYRKVVSALCSEEGE